MLIMALVLPASWAGLAVLAVVVVTIILVLVVDAAAAAAAIFFKLLLLLLLLLVVLVLMLMLMLLLLLLLSHQTQNDNNTVTKETFCWSLSSQASLPVCVILSSCRSCWTPGMGLLQQPSDGRQLSVSTRYVQPPNLTLATRERRYRRPTPFMTRSRSCRQSAAGWQARKGALAHFSAAGECQVAGKAVPLPMFRQL